jgi:hypothetical protein
MQLTVVLEIFCVGLIALAALGVAAWAGWAIRRVLRPLPADAEEAQ